MVKMNERVSFPARPMVGVVGVATAGETLATGHAGQHGGNLDDHWHGKGARIFFPVRQPGGMFAVGDMHAAMGDGEICFTGVEIAGEVDVRFELLKGKQATWPVTELPDRWVPHASAPDYADALQLVSEEAAKLLVDEHDFTIEDAFIFLSVACDAGVAQACKPAEGFGTIARFSIPKIDACPGPFRPLLMRLYVIPGGTIRIDKGAVFTPGIDDGLLIEIPVPVYLIRTDDGENVLVDTGMHPAHIDDPYHSFGVENVDTILPLMQPEDRLEHRLAEIGLETSDITHVVNTHLHADHCGGNFLFPHAEFIVQGEHYQEALDHPEIPDELFHRPELHYRLLDGDEQLFSGVRAICVPGHARGLQALLVSLPNSGSILIAGDAVDTAEHLERDLWTHCPEPGDGTQKRAAAGQHLAAEEGALLLYGHDAAQWQTLRLSPSVLRLGATNPRHGRRR